MFDAALQLRFWRNLSEAMTHGTEAMFAAATVWQKEVLTAAQEPERAQAAQQQPMAMLFWPMSYAGSPLMQRQVSSTPLAYFAPWAVAPDSNAFSLFAQWANFYSEAVKTMGPNGPYAQLTKTFAPYLPWPDLTWTYMQAPLTAMLMSSGLPYTVAAPSARASTCAMDAADAAREQMEKVYAAYRTDGGHAAAQLVMLPWTLAASFMTTAQTNAPSSTKIH